MDESESEDYCKKIIYNKGGVNETSPCVILGKIIFEDTFFIKVQTSNNTYSIQKSCIIQISDTKILFRGQL